MRPFLAPCLFSRWCTLPKSKAPLWNCHQRGFTYRVNLTREKNT
nr:MAG TPA: hypothetical protein [Caudoviricetes sp.]